MIWLELDFTENTTEAKTYPNPLLFRNLKEYHSQPSTTQISDDALNQVYILPPRLTIRLFGLWKIPYLWLPVRVHFHRARIGLSNRFRIDVKDIHPVVHTSVRAPSNHRFNPSKTKYFPEISFNLNK